MLRSLPADILIYGSRFSSAASANALALFGASGETDWPVKMTVTGEEAMKAAGMTAMIGRRAPPRAAAYRKHSVPPPG
ncbi:hypothetical protein [Paenarthrobacter sp. PH39-S1]|uniref:hypothetical protein n=1 Tax=Micrococcaceae TaxID=1268 RepID=UPI0024BB25EE|nr:hypothetical protein [Paenarthrobacter sp. PH39-S1]MDJ0355294.1 hypothetical protein [Paenarthrobacter sp. PH39-S1]